MLALFESLIESLSKQPRTPEQHRRLVFRIAKILNSTTLNQTNSIGRAEVSHLVHSNASPVLDRVQVDDIVRDLYTHSGDLAEPLIRCLCAISKQKSLIHVSDFSSSLSSHHQDLTKPPLLPTPPKPAFTHNTQLLKDILFCFQGVDGYYLRFSSPSQAYLFKPGTTDRISVEDQNMALELAQMGWLFNKARAQERALVDQLGVQSLACQALGYAVQDELRAYYHFIAVLDEHVEQGLSLHKMFVWSRAPYFKVGWVLVGG